jgi:hypothetical protein
MEMVGVVALLIAFPVPLSAEGDANDILVAEPLTALREEREAHFPPDTREPSKKETWLREKAHRPGVHVVDADLANVRHKKTAREKTGKTPTLEAEARLAEDPQPIGARREPITTLFNLWNRDALPLVVGLPYKRAFQPFLRDHYTHQWTQTDTHLAGILAAAAIRFRAPRVEIVSGYRSPKYNLVLRKKGHQVARESQHTQGTAVDFRIRGVTTEALREFVRGLRLGGVGYYPHARFIHADTGKIRYWQGS